MQALFQQASALHQAGNLSEAESIYRKILEQVPDQPVVKARLAMLLSQLKRLDEALAYFDEAIQAMPSEARLLNQGVDLAVQAGRPDLASSWIQKQIELNPKDQLLIEKLAGILVANHEEKSALDFAKKAIKINPKSANAHNIKGLALCRLGDVKKGYVSLQKAVTLDPSLIAGVKNLIMFGKPGKEPLLEKIIPQLRTAFNSGKYPPVAQMGLAQVLAIYYEKQKKHDDFFACLKAGNDISRQAYQYAHENTLARFRLIQRIFSKDRMAKALANEPVINDSSVTPIFILGMPRSGTTLIEQILSSHSQVKAGGELTYLDEVFQKYADEVDKQLDRSDSSEVFAKIAGEYVEKVNTKFGDSAFVTDKMPYNFIFIGLIKLAMPRAKIIHCTRDPMETCFSIYKQNFAGNHGYTDKLDEIGKYFNAYRSLMDYWQDVCGKDIFEANYEKMVDDSETEIKKLLQFSGLAEEEACFEFYKNKRAVRTASVAQVRQPIYKSALKASSPFEKQLNPLKQVLETGEGGAL